MDLFALRIYDLAEDLLLSLKISSPAVLTAHAVSFGSHFSYFNCDALGCIHINWHQHEVPLNRVLLVFRLRSSTRSVRVEVASLSTKFTPLSAHKPQFIQTHHKYYEDWKTRFFVGEYIIVFPNTKGLWCSN